MECTAGRAREWHCGMGQQQLAGWPGDRLDGWRHSVAPLAARPTQPASLPGSAPVNTRDFAAGQVGHQRPLLGLNRRQVV